MEQGEVGSFSIEDVIDEHLIELDINVCDKLEMLARLTDMLEAQGRLNDREGFLSDVLLREEQGPTGIGMGVAIPHGKSAGVNQTSLAIGVSRIPLAWESVEAEKVSIVILFAVASADSNALHIKLLQHVARLLAHDGFSRKLHDAKTRREILDLLKSNPEDYDDR